MASAATCLFCKIIRAEIPSLKLLETELSYAFLDIGPLAKGHSLIIPKYHAEKAHEIPDEHLADILPIAKKLAIAIGTPDYNILQNNGEIAHQVVKHVHFHLIPKPTATDAEGLVIGWPVQKLEMNELNKICEDIRSRI